MEHVAIDETPSNFGRGADLRFRTSLRCFQYHASIARSDAIGNSIRILDRVLRDRGIESWMVCADRQIRTSPGGVRPFSSIAGIDWRSTDLLLIHYSFYDECFAEIISLPVRKIVIYHNVTPAQFFRKPGMDYLAELCDRSLDQIRSAHGAFDAVVGDSNFNLQEMPDIGISKKTVIPVFFDELGFSDCVGSQHLYFDLKRRQDINLLFVGRFVPNKRHDKLISLLAESKKISGRRVTLHLAGKIWDTDYYLSLLSKAAAHEVLGDIRIYQDAPHEVVRTLFAAADAFVSMSEHEGFMVPILEAFAAGCPVVAHPTSAIGETMGGGGLRVYSGQPQDAAGLIELLFLDRQLRLDVVASQAARAFDFRTAETFSKWIDLFRHFEAIEEVAA